MKGKKKRKKENEQNKKKVFLLFNLSDWDWCRLFVY